MKGSDGVYLGTNKQDITPQEPIELAGYAHRKGKIAKKFSPLLIKTYMLQFEGEVFLLIVADIIWWDTVFVQILKEEIEDQFRIKGTHVVFHATHNHSGPQTSFQFSRELGRPSISYMHFLREKVIQGVREVFSNIEEVKVEVNRGAAHLGVYRRKWTEGKVQMAPDFEEKIDNDLTVFSFINKAGERKAIWIHYTCHPTSTDARVVSSEFVGQCCKKVEMFYPNSTAAFLQGFCGDIRPALIINKDFYRGTIEDMCGLGNNLTNSILKVLQDQGEVCEPAHFTFKETIFPLSFEDGGLTIDDAPETLKEEWPKLVKINNGRYELIISFIELGDKLKLFCCNAELVHAYGSYIKQRDRNITVMGYSNGMVGYIPTARQLEEGGYESEESIFYFGYPSKLSQTTEEEVFSQIDWIMNEIT